MPSPKAEAQVPPVTGTREAVLALYPSGAGEPDAITCRTPQLLPGSRLPGPEVCKINRVWAQLRAEGMDISPDGNMRDRHPVEKPGHAAGRRLLQWHADGAFLQRPQPILRLPLGMRGVAIAALLGMMAGTAHAQQGCGPLKLLSSQQMAHFGSTDVMVVPVTINGVDRSMILDTGAPQTQLSRGLAEELKLRLHRARAATWVNGTRGTNYSLGGETLDVSGHVSVSAATVQSLSFGKIQRQDVELHIWPDPGLRQSHAAAGGVLSHDLLLDYDVDVDFGTGILKLFDTDHCFGAIDYWHPLAIAAMKITFKNGHVHVPVMLDGHAFDAVIDTGSQYSIISLPVARMAFGLKPDSPGVTSLGAVNNDPALTGFMHTFASLSFGGVTVLTPDMMLLPDRMARGGDRSQQTNNRALFDRVLPEITIGMDVLQLSAHLSGAAEAQFLRLADVISRRRGADCQP